MTNPVSTRDPQAVQAAVVELFRAHYTDLPSEPLDHAFAVAEECFSGRHAGYQAIDARYHDFEHTLQGTLCLARLLAGRNRAGTMPVVTAGEFELAIIAALLHDTGYLKATADTIGTGAKYTLTHVTRSAEFAGRLLAEMGYAPAQCRAVQNMIRCTGVNADLTGIPFQNDLERTLGHALATADLLGQMAAEDYIEKLPMLFDEFTESARFSGKPGIISLFPTVAALIAGTPTFWEKYVKPKIEGDFGGLHRFLAEPPPTGRNAYIERIEANIARIRR